MDDADKASRDEAAKMQQFIERRRGTPANATGPRDCDDCGRQIAASRLSAQPGARRCVPCQNRVERR